VVSKEGVCNSRMVEIRLMGGCRMGLVIKVISSSFKVKSISCLIMCHLI